MQTEIIIAPPAGGSMSPTATWLEQIAAGWCVCEGCEGALAARPDDLGYFGCEVCRCAFRGLLLGGARHLAVRLATSCPHRDAVEAAFAG